MIRKGELGEPGESGVDGPKRKKPGDDGDMIPSFILLNYNVQKALLVTAPPDEREHVTVISSVQGGLVPNKISDLGADFGIIVVDFMVQISNAHQNQA